jgi:DNA polymerase-3 subunit delta'
MHVLYPWQRPDFERLIQIGRRPVHALLFKGAKGIGKLDLAMHYARSLLCQQPLEAGLGCGECPACHWFEQGTHPDFRLLQPEELASEGDEAEPKKKMARQISVEQVRSLADFLGMSAHQAGRRVVVIYPAESMNSSAANALLKSLEEPPSGVLFILVSHKPQRLLATIVSRCLSIAVTAPDAASAVSWLSEQGVMDPAEALAASGFSPLEALDADKHPGRAERAKLLSTLRNPEKLDPFLLAEGLQKTDQALVVQWLQQWCFDLSSARLAGRVRYHQADAAAIKRLAMAVPPLNLARMQKYLQTAKREAQHTLNPRLFFESLLLLYRQLMLE